ncbi:class I SAM-dependent methyltransferase [Pontibacter vulgaris]|uniref:class I SAM-dependent methyltransferase n=1 Tax=Pontibacter vulgaris TaxID=2905679 RepID=UPI001FA7A9DF|nr:class I SAM-dependent methyltransferase [Pontibacter vulgaris]
MDRNKITTETWDKLASAYQDRFMDLDLYNDTYDTFCQLIEKPYAKIFEIGCGPGNITRYLLSKRPDFKIEGIDVAPNMVQLAQANNPTASFKVMDCREIDTLTDKFDAIICGFCMPYLSKAECVKLISDCSNLLDSNGILYFSAIEGNYSKSGYETSSNGQYSMYVYYHEAEYLQKGLQENNFELIGLSRKQYPKPDNSSSTHMIFIARKK